MSQPFSRQVRIGLACAIAAVALGGVAAYADTATHNFSDDIPAFQQSHYLNTYTRSNTNVSSDIKFTSTSGNALMNVKAENLTTGNDYTEVKALSPDSAFHSIPNHTPAGQQSRLIVTQYDYNAIIVHAKGSFYLQ